MTARLVRSWMAYTMSFHTQRIMWGVFARALAVLYFATFASLIPQVLGLFGATGIFPIEETIRYVQENHGMFGALIFPTLFWLDTSNTVLFIVPSLGAALSIAAFFGKYSRSCFAVMWIFYLSLITIGGDFLYYPWDFLLMEAGFLAIFLPPLSALHTVAVMHDLPKFLPLAFQWIQFRHMFGMGLAKFLRPDEAWANLTYTKTFFLWQPNPGPFAWHFYHAPMSFHNGLAIGIFLTQVIAPFLLFGPRKIRQLAVASMIFSMIVIMITGNFGIFNLITIVLCIPFLDDELFLRLLQRGKNHSRPHMSQTGLLVNSLAIILIILGSLYPIALLHPHSDEISNRITWALTSKSAKKYFPDFLVAPMRILALYHVLHPHGFFRWPFYTRSVLLLEGSNDGINWDEYEYAFHTQDTTKRPIWFAPYQPRIDHQLFYEANGSNFYTIHFNPIDHALRIPPHDWLDRFVQRLLENNPHVLRLIGKNPFPDDPPKFIRGILYDYRYSTPDERSRDGVWWVRTVQNKEYYPPTEHK